MALKNREYFDDQTRFFHHAQQKISGVEYQQCFVILIQKVENLVSAPYFLRL